VKTTKTGKAKDERREKQTGPGVVMSDREWGMGKIS
jgi:hypothetical protein